MKKVWLSLLFFIGWMLSPFTWWNDFFINIPLSYLLANIIFYATRLPFEWLVIGSYWLTNVVGLVFMYYSGKLLILSFPNKIKAAVILLTALIIYSFIMMHLHRQGKLLPLGKFSLKVHLLKNSHF